MISPWEARPDIHIALSIPHSKSRSAADGLSSLFQIKNRLVFQQPVTAKLAERYVYSQAELLTAIDDAVSDNAKSWAARKIVLASSMQFSQTIIMPESCPALTIESSAYATIRASTPLDALFQMTTQQQNLWNIYGRVDPTDGHAIGALVSVRGSALLCSVSGCRTVGVARLLEVVGSGSLFQSGDITNNTHLPYHTGDYMTGDIYASSISGNRFLNSGGITLGSLGDGNSINGNIFASGYLDTSAGSGGNAICGNTSVTITRHPDDSVAGNT